MINKILQGIFNIIIFLVNLLLSPIELALSAVVPNFSNAITVVNNFVNHLKSFVPFVISYTGLNNTTLTIIASLLTAYIMIPLTAHAFKLVIKWYNAVKL